jgi:glutamyl-Q tRNA(Asp) synthetase
METQKPDSIRFLPGYGLADLDTCSSGYRGRFAPSPTGAMHFGSLVAALASCLEARAHGGVWLVRMEDVDAPRNVPGAAAAILAMLAAHGFVWDAPVLTQGKRIDAYRAALERLQADGRAYGCVCSRREIAVRATRPAQDGGLLYPGTCRAGLPPNVVPRAWRLRVEAGITRFLDGIQGEQAQDVGAAVGDFVLFRADGQYAYQLAVVVDDAFQGITHVVRGADLLDSTARQMHLQQALGLATPVYAHVPLAVNAKGEKLSKQTLAPALEARNAAQNLVAALAFLGHPTPPKLAGAGVEVVWAWARAHWDLRRVPRTRQIRKT